RVSGQGAGHGSDLTVGADYLGSEGDGRTARVAARYGSRWAVKSGCGIHGVCVERKTWLVYGSPRTGQVGKVRWVGLPWSWAARRASERAQGNGTDVVPENGQLCQVEPWKRGRGIFTLFLVLGGMLTLS
ncbi:hypothetical protein PspLS_09037, partial [Pyricularia sp. CBS 133598]